MFGYTILVALLYAHYILLEEDLKKQRVAKVELTQRQVMPDGFIPVNRSMFLPDGVKRVVERANGKFVKYQYVEDIRNGKESKVLETPE